MRSTPLQLLVTFIAAAVAAGLFVHRGLPPEKGLFTAVTDGDRTEMARSVRWGADPNAWRSCSLPPLHFAVVWCSDEAVEALLDLGTDPNATVRGSPPLLLAAGQRGSRRKARALLLHGAAVNQVGPGKDTPLHSAAFWGHKDIVRLLLDHGAEVNARDQRGYTPLGEAIRGDPDVLALLRKHGGTE